MSKILAPKYYVFAAAVLILQFFTFTAAQDVDVRITIAQGSAEIEGNFALDGPSSISFLDSYGPETQLVDRLSDVAIVRRGKDGPIAQRTRVKAGDVITASNIARFSYRTLLRPSQRPFAGAHLSWLTDIDGLLMLDDLLPQMAVKSATVAIEPPAGWKIFTTETELSPGVFRIRHLEKAVFYLGKDIRVVRAKAPTVIVSGNDWLFKDADAANMSAKIFDEYSKLFGPIKDIDPIVRIGKFPTEQMMGSWEADTRGQSVTIASMDTPFRSQSLQRLHEQLRHELFHLWVPGRLNLTGRYDWFYEGFAMYQSLKTGVAGNQIRFEDYLDTLSRARSIDGSGDRRLSLLDLSSTRWTGGNTRVYARGMLAAFACDLAMLRSSNGKRNVTDVIAAIVKEHSYPAAKMDGETAILSELRSRIELVPIVDRLITGIERFDFSYLLDAAGLEIVKNGSSESIKIVAKPNGKQKDLLKRLGSENWRNIR
jgi:hypothetical protein